MTTHAKLDIKNFQEIFKLHFPALCNFAKKYVFDLDTAKEIVHDCFINLWEKRETIELSNSIKSYLFTSVRNRCLNYIRDNKKFDRNILDFENGNINEIVEEYDFIVAEELEKKIKESIDQLPEKCKEVFMMSRFEDLKYAEIAEKLQISIKTVEAQMSKALMVLKSKLSEFISVLIIFLNFFKI